MVDVVGGAVVTGGVVTGGVVGPGPAPPAAAIAAFNGPNQESAIFWFPLLFGCTPSPVSLPVLNPVKISATVIGLWLVLLDAAHAGMAELNATTRCAQSGQEDGFMGVICATTMCMLLFEARIWSTSLENAVRIVDGEMLLHTSLVPSCSITMSGLETESHPGSWLLLAMPVARKPPWPSFSPSYGIPHPWPESVPTKSRPPVRPSA